MFAPLFRRILRTKFFSMKKHSENTAPTKSALPNVIPVFPLTGVLLLPGGQLPLNIFEPRYLDMVNAALATDRIIGMIQPNLTAEINQKSPPLHKIGCAGKITEFIETTDGRYLITLTGISRFSVQEELSAATTYRQIKADWSAFSSDINPQTCLGLDREHLHNLLKDYFSKEDLDCDWQTVEQTSDNKLITCLSMICPLEPLEKQALLEAECCKTRGKMFIAMMEMAVNSGNQNLSSKH